MNSRQLQYAVLLAKKRNFSQVAEQLHISQPALSKQIHHLENEIGVKLFSRTTPVSLTPAGEFFIPRAERMLFDEEQLLKNMERFRTGDRGKLTIGISPFRSLYMAPGLVQALKERFPTLQIVLAEYGRSLLMKEMEEGICDFAIVNLPVDQGNFLVTPLEEDTMVLAVPDNLLPLMEENDEASPFTRCSRLPFVVLSPGQEMRNLFDHLCKITGIQPPIHTEVVGITTAWEMVCAGVAATLIPKQFIRRGKAVGVTLFPIRQDSYTRQPAIILRRGQYVSPYARFAMDYLLEQAHKGED